MQINQFEIFSFKTYRIIKSFTNSTLRFDSITQWNTRVHQLNAQGYCPLRLPSYDAAKNLPKLSHNYCPNMLLCLLINCTNIQTSCVRCNIGLYVVTFRPWLMQYAQWLHFHLRSDILNKKFQRFSIYMMWRYSKG